MSSSSWKNAKTLGPVSAVREEQIVICEGRLETGSPETVAKSQCCARPREKDPSPKVSITLI